MKHLFLSFCLLSTASYALAADNRIAAAYKRSDSDFRIRCEYEDFTNFIQDIRPVSKVSFKPGHMMAQSFELITKNSTIPFNVKVYEYKGKSSFEMDFDGKRQTGLVEEGNNRYWKKQMRFSGPVVEKLVCFAEFATEDLYPLNDGKVHINVHPHQSFDVRGASLPATNKVYADASYKHIMLLEDGNFKEMNVNLLKFLRTGKLNIPMTNFSPIPVAYTANTELLVAPAGVNRYRIEAEKSLDILYTGGNHNYCVFNNINQVLDGLMRSQKSPVINLNFKQEAMVVQRDGVIDGLGFSRWGRIRNGNLMTYMMEDKDLAQKYHQVYFNYFANTYFAKLQHRFSQVVLTYRAPQFTKRVIIRGTGERDLAINFTYL